MKVGEYSFYLADNTPIPAERLRVVYDDEGGFGALFCGGVAELHVFNDVVADGSIAFVADRSRQSEGTIQVTAIGGTQVGPDDVIVLFRKSSGARD